MPLLSYQNPKLEIRAEKSLLQAAQKDPEASNCLKITEPQRSQTNESDV
jgi:hypothetical protein